MKKKVLFISNLFPCKQRPNFAQFSRQQIQALSSLDEVEVAVVAPVPWVNFYKTSPYKIGSVAVYHPTYYYVPKIFRGIYGVFFYYSIFRTVENLFRENNFDLIYSTWLYPDSWAAQKLAERHGVPHVVNVVGTDVNRLIDKTTLSHKSLSVVSRADAVTSVSKGLKDKLVGMGAESKKINVIYNGVDKSIFYPRDNVNVNMHSPLDSSSKIILFVGNLITGKGVFDLMEAFRVLSERDHSFVLVYIGAGPCRGKLEMRAEEYGLGDRVLFLGSKSLEEVSLWMNACDVFCLPSYSEGQPNVVIEALSCNTKVVATNVGGIPELDADQENMMLFSPGSVSQLVQSIDKMMARKGSYPSSPQIDSWLDNAKKIDHVFDKVCNNSL
jgi:glycosyltransferase involved in cell wall biosynthesis